MRFVAKRWTVGLAAEANLDAAGRCGSASVLVCQHGLSGIPWKSQNFNKKPKDKANKKNQKKKTYNTKFPKPKI